MLIFGTANFLAKPGQTLAPIIGTSLISAMTGKLIINYIHSLASKLVVPRYVKFIHLQLNMCYYRIPILNDKNPYIAFPNDNLR